MRTVPVTFIGMFGYVLGGAMIGALVTFNTMSRVYQPLERQDRIEALATNDLDSVYGELQYEGDNCGCHCHDWEPVPCRLCRHPDCWCRQCSVTTQVPHDWTNLLEGVTQCLRCKRVKVETEELK